MALVLSPEAEADLDAIWYYTATESGSPEIADRLIDRITERFLLLSRHPYLGRKRDQDLRPGIRSLVAGEYLILYRVRQNEADILHIVRGTRDVHALFGDHAISPPQR